MEHIPQPYDSDLDRILVPYIADQAPPYDGLGLQTFPLRCGYGMSDQGNLLYHHIQDHSPEDNRSFYQSWLWFGLLQDVLGSTFDREDFVRATQGDVRQKWLCTESLMMHIIRARDRSRERKMWSGVWQWRIKRHPVPLTRHQERILHTLTFVNHQCWQIETAVDSDDLDWGIILLSIRTLVEILTEVFTGYEVPGSVDPKSAGCLLSPIRQRILGKEGWCSPRLESVYRFIKVRPWTSLVYLSSLQRHPRPWQTHINCHIKGRCQAYNIDEETFRGVHVEPGCSCENIRAPREHMFSILRQGGMPAVRYREDAFGRPTLEYFRVSPISRYVAISHLWSSGLGNPKENSLPECQLKRVVQLVAKAMHTKSIWSDFQVNSKAYRGPIDFWLDVYCVPILPPRNGSATNRVQNVDRLPSMSAEDLRGLKTKALDWMVATYSWAQIVLVMDHELDEMSAEASPLEFQTRIQVSGWNSRYWTFHEQRLARVLIFQNGRNVSDWYGKLTSRRYKAPKHQVWLDGPASFNVLMKSHAEVAGLSALDPKYSDDFSWLWNELIDRETTKWEDALSIIANLLGYRGAEMVSMPIKDQMKAIIKTQSSLPFEILTIQVQRHGRNLDKSDRESAWIPQSPLGGECMTPSWPIEVCDNGIVIRFDRECPVAAVAFTSLESITRCLIVHVSGTSTSEPQPFPLIIKPEVPSAEELDIIVDFGPVECVILMESFALPTMSVADSGRGCLLIVSGTSRGTMHVRYGFPISWKAEDFEMTAQFAMSEECPELDAHVLATHDLKIQIDADIKSWPNLPRFKPREAPARWGSWVDRFTLLNGIALAFGFLGAFFILRALGFNPKSDKNWLEEIRNGVVFWFVVLGPFYLYKTCRLRARAQLSFAFAGSQFFPNRKRWQLLYDTLSTKEWSGMDWKEKFDTCAMYVIIGGVFVSDWLKIWLSRMGYHRRRTTWDFPQNLEERNPVAPYTDDEVEE